MDYKQIAMDDLRKHKYRKQSLEHLSQRIAALNSRLCSIPSPQLDGIPSQGISNRGEERVINILAEIERLGYARKSVQQLVELVDKGLSGLSKAERMVLEKFYIDRPVGHVEFLMEELNFEQRNIYKIKDRALQKFTISMYGILDM